MRDNPASANRAFPALAALSLTMLLPSLGTSIANIGLPAMAQAFGTSFAHVQWVVLAYLLAMTATIVSAGRLGDLAGRRSVMLAGTGIFVLGSALCAVAPTLGALLAARALQGLGAAAMMALTMALASEAVPKERMGSAMGVLTTMSAVGTALGPSLGGLLLARFGWQALFLVNLPLGIAALALGAATLPLPAPRGGANVRFDHMGTVTLALALAAYALAATSGGWAGAGLLAIAALAGTLFVMAEKRAPAPLVRLSMLRTPALGAGFAASTLVSSVVMATLVTGPFYLATAMQLAPARLGLVMSIGPVVAALTGAPAGRLADRFGAAAITIAGLFIILLGTAGFAAAPARLGLPGYVVPLVLVTAGYGLFQASNNTAVMAAVAQDERGVASAILTLARNLGLVSGASVMGALFASGGMRLTYAVAAGMVIAAVVLVSAARATTARASQA
ncbi:MAG TPA: MFS transporter [Telluria sp.]|nr:MFS transporter [Telluria sp.]